MVFTTVPFDKFVVDRGSEHIAKFQSTPFGERQFCRLCGSPLTIHVRHQVDEIDVCVGALDNPSAAEPGFHLFASEAPGWLNFSDGLPTYPALRPATRGLAPGQMPGE